MRRFWIFITCLVLTLIFTGAIVYTGNQKFVEASKKAKVFMAKGYIPQDTPFDLESLELIEVPDSIISNLIVETDKESLRGKAAAVSIMPNNYIFKNQVKHVSALDQNYDYITVKLDQSKSAMVVAGDTVDIYAVTTVSQNPVSQKLATNIKVRASYDTNGNIILPSTDSGLITGNLKSRVPAAAELRIPPDQKAATSTITAFDGKIHLVKRTSDQPETIKLDSKAPNAEGKITP